MPLTKPVTDDSRFEGLSLKAQNLYYRCRDRLCDMGYILNDPQYLKSTLYPLRDNIRCPDITALVVELRQSGMVRVTVNQHGRSVLHFPGCEQARKKAMSSEHVPPKEKNQEFLSISTDKKKEGRKEEEPPAPANDANIPTLEEVYQVASMSGITQSSAKSFYDYHEDNNLWLNKFDRLINWRSKLKTWSETDRAANQTGQKPHANKPNHKRTDFNQGTSNDGKAGQYAGVGKVGRV